MTDTTFQELPAIFSVINLWGKMVTAIVLPYAKPVARYKIDSNKKENSLLFSPSS